MVKKKLKKSPTSLQKSAEAGSYSWNLSKETIYDAEQSAVLQYNIVVLGRAKQQL